MDDPDRLKKIVGSKAKQLRKMAGFKNAEAAADAVGFSSNSIYELERGENWISQEMLIRLCSVYRANPADFFPGAEDPRLELLRLVPYLSKHAAASVLETVRGIVQSSDQDKRARPG